MMYRFLKASIEKTSVYRIDTYVRENTFGKFSLVTAEVLRQTATRQGQQVPWGGGLTCQRPHWMTGRGVYIKPQSAVVTTSTIEKTKKLSLTWQG